MVPITFFFLLRQYFLSIIDVNSLASTWNTPTFSEYRCSHSTVLCVAYTGLDTQGWNRQISELSLCFSGCSRGVGWGEFDAFSKRTSLMSPRSYSGSVQWWIHFPPDPQAEDASFLPEGLILPFQFPCNLKTLFPYRENGTTAVQWALSLERKTSPLSQVLWCQGIKQRAGHLQKIREGINTVCRNALNQGLHFKQVWSKECGLINEGAEANLPFLLQARSQNFPGGSDVMCET